MLGALADFPAQPCQLTCRFKDPSVPAELVELCSIDLLHAAPNLAPLPNGQAAVGAQGALQIFITGCIKWHLRRPAARHDAPLTRSLCIVPAV
jgi:hypothetical protein